MDKKVISIEKRKQLLLRLKRMLMKNEGALLQALQADLGKPQMEGYTSEIAVLLNEIDFTLRQLHKWVKPEKKYEIKIGYFAKITKRPVPYGRVLIISPWNYPLQLALLPVINAIAAGNICVIKPSEYAPVTNKLLKKLIHSHFTEKEICVVTGGAAVAQRLIARGFDLIIFTGSHEVGQKVYEQAAAKLTPTIMELGGKNACIIDETAFKEVHIREIVWGKFFNAGQTCIAPDTLYVPESIYTKVVEMVVRTILNFYGEEPDECSDFATIGHDVHFKRVREFLSQGTIVHGGKVDASRRSISPTVLTDIDESSEIMKKEIFGPLLPIIPYSSLESLLASDLLQKDALTTYLFTKKMDQIQLLRQNLKGMVSVNKVIHHAGSSQVAFGGIGRSGFGAYHGEAGFSACSYQQTDYRAFNYKYLRKKYPPYYDHAFVWVRRLRRWIF
ncbi:aldehyde dehydrogenase family protein [Fredinandcohnia sp. QZ13]|uniref:aldehyde dehydrogenase family protein n=1 Tax=Fredinandcohnia sp. QZ13 TaxID=3073144 RepID=UPI0028531948|nr:aldehyde dehydrogenase family protein [Fredinandcohnia sp. QZ13]MDR4890454.1 aldehyde dehydrogenase family protein [Fredinandcohnia sp. QZ13]